jgi:outer membrane protein TolC
VLGAVARYGASESGLQLEVAQQYPDLHLGPGYQDDQGSGKSSMLLTSLLPIVSWNRGPIAEAEARRAGEAAGVSAAEARALAEAETARAGLLAAAEKFRAADGALADAHRLEESTRRELLAGEISKLELGAAELEGITRERARFQALVELQEAQGRLEAALQVPQDLPWDPAAGQPIDGRSLLERRTLP